MRGKVILILLVLFGTVIESQMAKDLDFSKMLELKTLMNNQAKKLARFPGQTMSLRVRELTPTTAKYLAKWKGKSLYLENLSRINAKTAKNLVMWKGSSLYISTKHKVSDATIQNLTAFTGYSLYLNGERLNTSRNSQSSSATPKLNRSSQQVTGASKQALENAVISISHQKRINEEDATTLKKFSGSVLALQTKQLSSKSAKILISWNGKDLALNQLKRISMDVVKILILWKGKILRFNGVESLKIGIAKQLALWKGESLHLNGLTEFDADVMEEFVKWNGKSLYLDGLQKINRKTALKLSQWNGEILSLSGLTSLDSDTAKALFQWKGKDLNLDGLSFIDNIDLIVSWQGSSLYLNGVTEIDSDIIESLKGWRGKELYFTGLQLIDLPTAKSLITWNGAELHLEIKNRLDDPLKKVLSKFKGKNLFINNEELKAKKEVKDFVGNKFFNEGMLQHKENNLAAAKINFIHFFEATNKRVSTPPYKEKWEEIHEKFPNLFKELQQAKKLYENATAQKAKRNYQESIKLFSQTIKRNPIFFEAYLGRAGARYANKDKKGAEKDFLKYLELTATSTDSKVKQNRKLIYKRFPKIGK